MAATIVLGIIVERRASSNLVSSTERRKNCGNKTWMGETLPLEVHHKDGNKRNNKLENLEILCPNCHSLTDTYKNKNIKKKNV